MIDWFRDDGVNLPMINDHVRNRFYDKIMATTVRDRRCLEIGFGTGLLSILALKHGAQHITAFEYDPDRYELGKRIITHLGLNDKINLIHKRFDHSDYSNYDTQVVFSEIVSESLFAEGIWSTIPRAPADQEFIPQYLGMDVVVCAVTDAMARGIDRNILKFSENGFNPGVDIDHRFVTYINQLINNPVDTSQAFADPAPGRRRIKRNQSTDWNYIPWRKLALLGGRREARYIIDIKNQKLHRWDTDNDGTVLDIDFDQPNITLTINPTQDQKNIVVWPRVWIATQQDTLMLDDAVWGEMDPYLFIGQQDAIKVSQNFINGKITIE